MMLTLVWVTLRPVPTLGIVYLWPLSPLTGTLVGDEARGYLEGKVLVCEESADEFSYLGIVFCFPIYGPSRRSDLGEHRQSHNMPRWAEGTVYRL
jgi:hypothetical protein